MNNYIWKPNIHVKYNENFFNFEVCSGYVLQFVDPEVDEILLEPEVANKVLGKAVLKCLKQSRHLPRDYSWKLQQQTIEKYQDWIKDRIKRYNYKSKRDLFKNMKDCRIYLEEHIIIIEPSVHDRLEGWSGDGFVEEDYVKIPVDSPPEEIGAALRLAFTRCK